MIIRTPQQRKRRADADPEAGADLAVVESVGDVTGRSPVSDRRLVLYDRPTALVPSGASGEPFDDMVCTYHCRQMVRSLRPCLALLWFRSLELSNIFYPLNIFVIEVRSTYQHPLEAH